MRFRDPPASPTRVGAATRPLRCPLRGRIESLAPGARGLGWQKSSQVKVFCPAFLQKSGRGPGAEPMAARRSARNSPCAHKAQEGVKGGTLAGGSPFAGGLSRPQPVRFTDAHSHPTPGGGRRNVVRPAETVTAGRRGRRPLQGGWETGRAPRDLLRYYPAPGRGSAERSDAGGDRSSGTSRTPSPTGRLRQREVSDNTASGRGWNPAPTRNFDVFCSNVRFA